MFRKQSPSSFPLQSNWNKLIFFFEWDLWKNIVYRKFSIKHHFRLSMQAKAIQWRKKIFRSRNMNCKIKLIAYLMNIFFLFKVDEEWRNYERRCNTILITLQNDFFFIFWTIYDFQHFLLSPFIWNNIVKECQRTFTTTLVKNEWRSVGLK